MDIKKGCRQTNTYNTCTCVRIDNKIMVLNIFQVASDLFTLFSSNLSQWNLVLNSNRINLRHLEIIWKWLGSNLEIFWKFIELILDPAFGTIWNPFRNVFQYSEWWFGNSKCNFEVLHTGAAERLFRIHIIDKFKCPWLEFETDRP